MNEKAFKELNYILREHSERLLWVGMPIDTNPDWKKNFRKEMNRFYVSIHDFLIKHNIMSEEQLYDLVLERLRDKWERENKNK